MLLILEVLLTVSAWRKGWGPMALLPIAIGVPVAVLIATSTGSIASAIFVDLAITGVLIAMSVNGRKPQLAAQPAPAAPVHDASRQNAA